MLYRWTMLAVVLGVFLVTPSIARGDDVDDLRAAYEQYLAAFNQNDLAAATAFLHDEVMVFGLDGPFPIAGKAALLPLLEMLFSNSESYTARAINPKFRVIGSSGIIIGNGTATVKPKDGPLATSFVRVLQSWVKMDGQWRLVASHLSYVPPGN